MISTTQSTKSLNNIFGGTMVGVHFSVFVFCLLSSESVYVCRFAKNVKKIGILNLTITLN
jgi:hypothetical protein